MPEYYFLLEYGIILKLFRDQFLVCNMKNTDIIQDYLLTV